jgi:NADP-dependent 3-hydroxy acid dehydrogenase YdfG
MTNEEIHKFGEIQYLKGRLDELHKALPTVLDLTRQRKLDQRIEKYFNKLKRVDEVAYNLYMVELRTRQRSKEKSKAEIKDLLQTIIDVHDLDEVVMEMIQKQLNKYD